MIKKSNKLKKINKEKFIKFFIAHQVLNVAKFVNIERSF